MAATQLRLNVGQTEFQIVTTTDPNAITADIELNVNTDSSTVSDAEAAGGVRIPKKSEILQALEMLMNQIVKTWPGP